MADSDKNNLHAGHRMKMKKRFEEDGFRQFEDHNVLEFILFFAIPRRDTNEIAHRLINRFGSLNAVLEAKPEELRKVDGVGEHTAMLISSYMHVARRYADGIARGKKPLPSYKEMGKLLVSRFAGMDHEQTYVILYDLSFQRCADFVLHDGDVNSTGFSLRKLGEQIIRNKGSYMVMAHNHPGGLPIASPDDLESTDRVREFVLEMGVDLIDHFIIGKGSFSSIQKEMYNEYYHEFKHPEL